MKLSWLFGGVLIFAAGCTSTGAAVGNSTTQQNIQSIFEIPQNPIQVNITLDSTNQTQALISPEGGNLTAQGADGTVYVLEIPAKALVTDTNIRMTPVSAITGLPFGDGTTFTVHLEPEGLQLYETAVLTITPPNDLPVDQQLMFDYHGQGDDLILAIPVLDSKEIKIQVTHFSGYGVTKGLLADIEPVRERIGGSAERRLQTRVAEELSRERQRQLLGNTDGESSVDFPAYFEEFYSQVVEPRLAAAGESCAAGRLALQTVLGYDRQRQLLGISESGGTSIDSDLMGTVANVCMQEEYEMCRDDHIVHRIIPAWLGLERQYQLLGLGTGESGTPVIENAKEYVRRCLSFELQFESDAEMHEEGGGYTSSVESKITYQVDPDNLGNLATQAPLINTAFEARMDGCSVTSNRGGATFELQDFSFSVDYHSAQDQVGYVRDINLTYFPGATKESYSINCDGSQFSFPESPLWSAIFLSLHQDEFNQAGGFVADGWEINGHELFATREWIKDEPSMASTERGTFKLYHRPK